MKILKEGKTLNKSQTMYFICHKCDCEYSCETTESICEEFTAYTHHGTYYKCNCPNCNNSNIGLTYRNYLLSRPVKN